jgi:hypothetical protein
MKNEKKDYSWVWWIVGFFMLWVFGKSCNGNSSTNSPSYPFDQGEQNEIMLDAQSDPPIRVYDPGSQYDEQLSREATNDYWDQYSIGQSQSPSGCPTGCVFPPSGCVIKGNISFNTGEKIYHLPGDSYYNATTINPDFGERWFCTEAEALANGWRHAAK